MIVNDLYASTYVQTGIYDNRWHAIGVCKASAESYFPYESIHQTIGKQAPAETVCSTNQQSYLGTTTWYSLHPNYIVVQLNETETYVTSNSDLLYKFVGADCGPGMHYDNIDEVCLYSCPPGEEWNAELKTCRAPSCEEPKTQWNGTTCVCPANTSYNSQLNLCLSDLCGDGSTRNQLTGLCPNDCPEGEQSGRYGTGSEIPSVICSGVMGCEMVQDGVGLHLPRNNSWYSTYKYTGYACAGGPDDGIGEGDLEDQCPDGQVPKSCPGSSVTYCMLPSEKLDCSNLGQDDPLPHGTDDTPGSSNPYEKTSGTDDGGPTSSDTTTGVTITENGDGTATKVTTTTTTTTYGNGNTKTTTGVKTEQIDLSSGNVTGTTYNETTTGDGDQGDTVTGNNQCDRSPSCTGNAIQCAQLFNTWKQKCIAQQDSPSYYCLNNPSSIWCQQPSDITNDVLGDDQEINVGSIEIEVLPQNNSCPAPLAVNTIIAGTISIDLTPMCDMAGYIKPIILVLAWLSASFIFIKGFE